MKVPPPAHPPTCPNCNGTGMEPLLSNASCSFCHPEEYEPEAAHPQDELDEVLYRVFRTGYFCGRGDTYEANHSTETILEAKAALLAYDDRQQESLKVRHAAEMSILDQEIMSLKAKLGADHE